MMSFSHLLPDPPNPYPTNLTFFLTPPFLHLFLNPLVLFALADCWGLCRVTDRPAITSLKRNWLSLSRHQSSANSALAMVGTSCPSPISHARMFSGLCFCRLSTCFHDICRFIYTYTLPVWKTLFSWSCLPPLLKICPISLLPYVFLNLMEVDVI